LPSVLAVKNLRRIKAFSPQRRKDRKGRQEIQACLLLLSVLAVRILGFGFAGLLGAQFTITFFCLAKNPIRNQWPVSL
jgi:hypothetical protein